MTVSRTQTHTKNGEHTQGDTTERMDSPDCAGQGVRDLEKLRQHVVYTDGILRSDSAKSVWRVIVQSQMNYSVSFLCGGHSAIRVCQGNDNDILPQTADLGEKLCVSQCTLLFHTVTNVLILQSPVVKTLATYVANVSIQISDRSDGTGSTK